MFFPKTPQPASLADRGAVVPFQTPALLATRARTDARAGIAAVVPNFAGNGAQFIIPWRDLPTTFVLNAADQALHRAIMQDSAVTPELVEKAVRRVAATGAAGPQAHAEMLRAQEAERIRRTRLQTILLVYMARLHAGPAAQDADLATLLRRLRGSLSLGSGEELATRFGVLAQELLPVGLPEHGELRLAGRLRMLLGDIDNMRRHLVRRAADMPELTELANRFHRSSNDTLRAARRAVQTIDLWLLELPAQLSAWPDSLTALQQQIQRLAWLLDGWEQAIAWYANCVAEWLTPARERHLARLALLAPIIPVHEIGVGLIGETNTAGELAALLAEARRAAFGLIAPW
jgi:hypothetical protein